MASGDVIFQITNMQVHGDSSELVGTNPNQRVDQASEFNGGTSVVPSSGVSLAEAVAIVLRRPVAAGTNPPETLFDSTKLYKLTIEEA